MSISIEEGENYEGEDHIVEVECLVHKAGFDENIGGRMVMPSNSVYTTDFVHDGDLAVSIGIRSGQVTELFHVNSTSLGKQNWSKDQHVRIVFTLHTAL